MRWIVHSALILALTVLTQIGGAIYAATLWGRRFAPFAGTRAGFAALFLGVYALAWWPITKLAALSGRVAMPCVSSDETPLSASVFSCALHRHYAKPELVDIAADLARAANERFPNTLTRALDGGFPFFNGVPLPPHLSHDDGEKLDLSFYYARDGVYQRGALGSPLGYWKFEEPAQSEPQPCRGETRGFRWDMKWFAPFTARSLDLDEDRTRFALRWLAREGARRGIGKIFVEPHLAQRLGVASQVVRLQGCYAARHDDHIHIQLR